MSYEEIYKYLNEHSPDGVEFSYPDNRDYWHNTYKGNSEGVWFRIPRNITIEELDKVISSSIKHFDIEMVPPVDGILV